jgi:hypothetical protein
MQGELRVERPDLSIELHGVNAAGHESGNAQVCSGRNIPWLQDDAASNAYALWAVTYRDCVILDEANHVHDVYNLTQHDLNLTANYNELKAMLIAAAGG